MPHLEIRAVLAALQPTDVPRDLRVQALQPLLQRQTLCQQARLNRAQSLRACFPRALCVSHPPSFDSIWIRQAPSLVRRLHTIWMRCTPSPVIRPHVNYVRCSPSPHSNFPAVFICCVVRPAFTILAVFVRCVVRPALRLLTLPYCGSGGSRSCSEDHVPF